MFTDTINESGIIRPARKGRISWLRGNRMRALFACGSVLATLTLGVGGCPTDPEQDVQNEERSKNDVNPNPQPNPQPEPQPTPGPTGDTERTFGATIPDPAQISRLPQAFNPMASANASLPPSVDLSGSMPPVGDQGQLGSCVAWASAHGLATFNANVERQWGAGSADHWASAAFHYAELLKQSGGACGDGTSIKTGMDLLISQGCPTAAAVPYSDRQCVNGAGNDGQFRIGSYNRVDPKNRAAVKAELAAGSLVVFGTTLHESFMNFTGSEVFRGSGPLVTQANMHAAHAMVLIGYDDARGAYRLQNSWGTRWGDAGRMWIAYETIEELAFEAYSAVPQANPNPGPQPQPEPQPEPQPQPGPDEVVIPDLYINDSFQTVQWDWFGTAWVYLVFDYSFSEPVYLAEVIGTDPFGMSSVQPIEMYFQDGYVYWVRNDGFQWMPGTYTLEFHVITLDGIEVTYTGDMEVAELMGASAKARTINFRGREMTLPAASGAEKLQSAGMDAGALGANRQPVEFR
jgi:C1A family cysteine protease